MAKMIDADERDDAERLIREAGFDPAEFQFVRSDSYPVEPGPIKRTIIVGRGKAELQFDGATWVTDLEKALKDGRFK